MKIEISKRYLNWVVKGEISRGNAKRKLTKKELTKYINEVLNNHRISWESIDQE